MAPVSSFQDFAFSGYEAFALNQDIARSYDFRKRNTDPSEAQKVVSKLPSNLKAVAAVLGTVGGVVFRESRGAHLMSYDLLTQA